MKLYLFLFLSIFLVKDCSKKNAKTNFFEGNFTVVQIHDVAVKKKEITFSINPKGQTISGNSGCNQFSATYKLDQNHVLFSGFTATKVYCSNLEVKENVVFECFKNSTSYLSLIHI